jgi:hypothetical protein
VQALAVRNKAKLAKKVRRSRFRERKQIAGMKPDRGTAPQGGARLSADARNALPEAGNPLGSRFTRDLIEPAPTGEFGGGSPHCVLAQARQIFSTVIWEGTRRPGTTARRNRIRRTLAQYPGKQTEFKFREAVANLFGVARPKSQPFGSHVRVAT